MSHESAGASDTTEDEVERLIGRLGDGSAHFQTREDAAYELGMSRDPRGLEPLLAMVDYADPEGDDDELEYFSVRHAVVGALGDLGDLRAVDPLIRLLTDSDAEIVKKAAGALAKLGDERAIAPLREVDAVYDADYVYVAAGQAIDVIRRTTRRREAMLETWELDAWGKGVLILKKGESDATLELWKTDENGFPAIAEGMQALGGEGVPWPDEPAPIKIWPDGRFVLYRVPWAAPAELPAWGAHIEQMDDRLSFDRDQSLGGPSEWDFPAESEERPVPPPGEG